MPLLECTQVRPSTLVRGPTALSSVSTSASAVAAAASSNSGTLRMLAPLRWMASRIASWWE